MALSPAARRDLRLLVVVAAVSALGDEVALIALLLRVAHGGIASHGWLVAALSIAGALPFVVLAGPAGLVVDRVRARPLLIGLGLAEALVAAGLGYAHNDVVTVLLMALLSSAVAFSRPGYSALLPSLVGLENVAPAQSGLQAGGSLALAIGPALGGLLVGTIGQSGPLYLDAASFLVAAALTALLRGERAPTHADAARERGAMLAGARFIVSSPTLRPVVVTVGVLMLSLGAMLLLAGLSVDIVMLWVVLLATGVLVGLVNVLFSVLFTLEAPPEVRGRVFAAATGVFTTGQMGSMVLGGALLSVLSPRAIFVLAGAVAAVTVAAVIPLECRVRHAQGEYRVSSQPPEASGV
jgi:MFS family permease